jgi:hypothetical protein
MGRFRRFVVMLAAGIFAFGLAAYAQDDSPSLGEVARQSRLQKQQQDAGKEDQSKDAPAKGSADKGSASKSAATDAPAAAPAPGAAKAAPGKAANNLAPNHVAPSPDAQSKALPGQDGTAKDAPPGKTGKKVVITNDEIPEHIGATRTSASYSQNGGTYPQTVAGGKQAQGDTFREQILAQKGSIASLEKQIEEVNASIQYAGGNCVSGCVEWNERQKQKQDQVESMKVQLEQMRKQLEEAQEMCRKQGFGSSVYDP